MPVVATAAAGLLPGRNKLYDYRTCVQLQDDFLSGGNTTAVVGALGWHFVGGVYAVQASEAGHPGIGRRNTTAASGTVSYTILNNTKQDILTAGPLDLLWVARLNDIDANTTARVGAGYLVNLAQPTNGQYFEKLDADTNWFCVTRAAGVQTRTDTGVAVNTAFHTFSIIRTGSSVRFELDGVVVATHTTHIPSQALTPAIQIINSAAADKTIDLDYFELEYEVSR